MTQDKRAVWVIALILVAAGLAQYANFLSQGPASQYREYYSHTRFPDISVYIADAQFNLSSRSITYRLQFGIITSRYQGAGLTADFANSLTGGFSIYLNSTRWGGNGAKVSYDANQVGTKDELYGLSELYPYDIYKAQYRVAISTPSPFDFSQNFVPYVFAYMKYPESLNWEIQASATRIDQRNSTSGSVLSFELTISVLRIPGYASLISLVPVWAASVVLGSTVFLSDKKRGKEVPEIVERLTVYISLFVFIPAFLYLIDSQIPLKLLPSIAELLLVALLSSTAAFVVFSNLSKHTGKSWDGHAVFFSILSLCLFVCVDPVYYMLYEVRVDPHYGLDLGTFAQIASWFSDPKVLPWMVLISMAYLVPYLKVYRSSGNCRLWIFLTGALVFLATSFEPFHDPTLALIGAGYVLFALWRHFDGKRTALRGTVRESDVHRGPTDQLKIGELATPLERERKWQTEMQHISTTRKSAPRHRLHPPHKRRKSRSPRRV